MKNKTQFIEEIKTNYPLIIGGKERIIPELKFVKHPRSNEWSLSSVEFQRIMKDVAETILNGTEPLLVDEHESLQHYFRIKDIDTANALNVPEGTVSRWKTRRGTSLSEEESAAIRSFYRRLQASKE